MMVFSVGASPAEQHEISGNGGRIRAFLPKTSQPQEESFYLALTSNARPCIILTDRFPKVDFRANFGRMLDNGSGKWYSYGHMESCPRGLRSQS